jgi:hypothetical protein
MTLWDRWLQGACLLFALQSLGWVVWGSFDPFGWWDQMASPALFSQQPDPELVRYRSVLLGPFGATNTAYFLLAWALVTYAFPRRERWAWFAFAGSLAAWFCVDSAASVARGAAFNVLVVNLPCLVVLAVPLSALLLKFGAISPELTPGGPS